MVRVSSPIGAVAFILCAVPGLAQTPPAAASAQTAPGTSVVSDVQEVLVDLVARDKKGNPVPNLQAQDLEILDDGKPVKIKNFRFIAGGAAPAAKDGEQTQAHLTRVVSLVFEHVGNESARLAREAAEEMLKTDPLADVYFAVLQVSGRLHLLQPWTTDRALVRRAVEAATTGARTHSNFDAQAAERTLVSSYSSSGSDTQQLLQGNASLGNTALGGPSFAPAMIQILQQSEQVARDQQSRPSLTGLLALAQQQASLSGRKAIVYFCEGLPLTASTKDALTSLTAAANRANVSIYTVDVSGLTMENQTEAGRQMLATAAQASRYSIAMPSGPTTFNGPPQSGAGASGGTGAPQGSQDLFRMSDRARDAIVSSSQSSLIDLARNTGAFYIGNSNDLRKPSRRLMEEIASYYEASYVPENPKYDGRFHPIVVKVLRKNVGVQARNGYIALPPGTPPNMQPWEAGMLKYLAAPEPPMQLDFHSRIVSFGRSGAGTAASLVIELPLGQMEHREDPNTKTFQLHPAVLALLEDESGRVVQKFSQDLPYRGALQALDAVRDAAYTMQRTFTAKPGKYSLEVAVSDTIGGKAAARREAVSIPAVAPGLGLSGLALVRRCEALPDSADTGEPFRYRNVRVVPSLEPEFDKEKVQVIPAFFVVYPDPAVKAKPKLELELSWKGKSLGRFPLQLPDAKGAAVPFMASIPSAPLRPGAYELTAIVTQGAAVVQHKTSFTLEGPEPAPEVIASAALAPVSTRIGRAEDIDPAEKTLPLAKLREAIAITSVENAARPSPDEEKRIREIARQRALEYESTLPNFTCIQKTRRLIDPAGNGKWRQSDNMTELLRYLDHEEVRRTLDVNGSTEYPRAALQGFLSTGEFSVLLQSVFSPEVKAQIDWKELANLAGHTCHVFSFHVDARNSKYALRAGPHGNMRRNVAYHGLVYIDANSYAIRRISIEAENVPQEFPVKASSLWVNYDLMQLGEHEYMLPISAEVVARTGKHRLVRNEIAFRDYRRFGAEATVKFGDIH